MWGKAEKPTPSGEMQGSEDSEFGLMWSLYLCIIVICLVFQVLATFSLLTHFLRTLSQVCRRRKPRVVNSAVAAVVPCFLPNEEKIIKDTIEHIIKETHGVEQLDVHVVYNTPYDMEEIEAELQEMAGREWPEGRRLLVERVELSTSKAANLNHIIPQLRADYVVIYDADHFPDPTSLARSINHLQDNHLDCVQGSTYIREGCCLLRSIVHAEFFVTYFVALPVMTEITGLAFFGGSNAVWATPALKKLEFDHKMLTEDIDVSLRAILTQHLRFGFLPESRSGELAPAGLTALWKQRLRWAMGWDQVTLRYSPFFADVPWKKRLGLYYVFVLRWLMQFCACVTVLFNAAYAVVPLFSEEAKSLQPPLISEAQLFSGRLFLLHVISAYVQMLLQEPHFRLFLGLTLYFWLLPIMLMLNTAILMTSLVKITLGGATTWVVTSRASTDTSSGPAIMPDHPFRRVWWVLGVAFTLMGGLCGSLVGRLLGNRTVAHHHKLKALGFIVYGTSTTYTTVVDGKVVALGCMIGVLAGLLLLLLVLLCWRKLEADCETSMRTRSMDDSIDGECDRTIFLGGEPIMMATYSKQEGQIMLQERFDGPEDAYTIPSEETLSMLHGCEASP